MANLDGIKQVEQICTDSERKNLTPLSDQVGNSRGNFDKKLKEVSSFTNYLSGKKPLNTQELENTLNGVLKKMIPEIQKDASNGCISSAKAIQEATAHLSNQEAINKYIANNKWISEASVAWLWNISKYASGSNFDRRMEAAWVK